MIDYLEYITTGTIVDIKTGGNEIMLKTNIKTDTYKIYIPEEYFIDIIEDESKSLYEAWIYQEDIAYKLFMFGMPKQQQSKEQFIEIVEGNIPEYAIMYCCEINEMEEKYEEKQNTNF